MKIVTLMENEAINSSYKHVHGLSLYIEWKQKKILFDLGPNKHFLTNAKALDIDIGEVDMVFISHGHYDHGLGLKTFMQHNQKATIYLSDKAFGKQTKKIGRIFIPIGLKQPKHMERIEMIGKDREILPGCQVFTDVPFSERVIGDSSLYTSKDNTRVKDTFTHEIYLVLEEGERKVLFSGCSHKGIEQIIAEIEARTKTRFTDVIGGFHLMHYDPTHPEETAYLKDLSDQLTASRDTMFYSCHCTGNVAYDEMKKHMQTNLDRIKSGSVLDL